MREFIPSGSFKNEEILSAIRWYFESKNYHLEEALKVVTPLSREDSKRLRICYSNYFVAVMSALELLQDSNYQNKEKFKSSLFSGFIFEGFPNGEENYSYLKELRNCIVHRGYDITMAAHTPGGHPLLIAPKSIPNRNGNKEYNTFGKCLLEIVANIESVVGGLVYDHVVEVGLFEETLSQGEKVSRIKGFITGTDIIPDEFKEMMLNSISEIDFGEMSENQSSNFEEFVKFSVLRQENA